MVGRKVSAQELSVLLGNWLETRPAYVALAARIRSLVLDGHLPLTTQLPSERDLAAVLPISRTVVSASYAVLRDQGMLVSRHGARSYLTLPDDPIGGFHSAGAAPGQLDLTRAAPPAPVALLREAMTTALDALPERYRTDAGYELRGLAQLRLAIAETFRRRGLPTTPDQILVTSGAQHGLALVLRALVGPGDRVLVECPTYPNALIALAQAGARAVAAPVGSAGWDLDAVDAALRQAAPSLAYLVPDFHNPTGALLDESGRSKLVDSMRANRTTLVVDEALVDLRLDGPVVPPPVSALDDSVVTLGSLSKTCWGGLRIGWVRARPDLIDQLVRTRPGTDLGTPILEQLAAAHLLSAPDGIRAAMLSRLRQQRDAMSRALTKALPDFRFVRPHGGLALWVQVPMSSRALSRAAERHGLSLSPGSRFGAAPGLDRWLRLPFSLSATDLEEAVDRLAAAADDVATGGVLPDPSATV